MKDSMKGHISTILLIVFFVKFCYVIMTFAEFSLNHSSLPPGFRVISSTFFENDSGWYANIAENGYPEVDGPEDLGCCTPECFSQSAYAFLPLYPLGVRAVHKVMPFSVKGAAIFLSTFLSVLMFFAFYGFMYDRIGSRKSALYLTMVLLLFPFHYFFSMAYSESLFLLLLILTFWAVHRHHYKTASISWALLVICRPTGLMMGLPLAIFLYEEMRVKGRVTGDLKRDALLYSSRLALFMPGLLTFAGYCWWLYMNTGDPFAFAAAQKGWCKQFIFPLASLFRGDGQEVAVNSIYLVLMMGVAVYAGITRKITLSFQVLIWINILIPLTAGSVISMPRYISVVFPLFLVIGLAMDKSRHRLTWLFVLGALQMWTYHYWLISPHRLGM